MIRTKNRSHRRTPRSRKKDFACDSGNSVSKASLLSLTDMYGFNCAGTLQWSAAFEIDIPSDLHGSCRKGVSRRNINDLAMSVARFNLSLLSTCIESPIVVGVSVFGCKSSLRVQDGTATYAFVRQAGRFESRIRHPSRPTWMRKCVLRRREDLSREHMLNRRWEDWLVSVVPNQWT